METFEPTTSINGLAIFIHFIVRHLNAQSALLPNSLMQDLLSKSQRTVLATEEFRGGFEPLKAIHLRVAGLLFQILVLLLLGVLCLDFRDRAHSKRCVVASSCC